MWKTGTSSNVGNKNNVFKLYILICIIRNIGEGKDESAKEKYVNLGNEMNKIRDEMNNARQAIKEEYDKKFDELQKKRDEIIENPDMYKY